MQIELTIPCGRVRATKHAPHDRHCLLERRHGLAEIAERGACVKVERLPVNTPQPKRMFTSLAKNASRHEYGFVQQCLGFFEALQMGIHGAGVYYVGVAGGVAASAQCLRGQDSGVYAVQPKGFCRFARIVEQGVVCLKPLRIAVNFAPAAREYQGRAHLRKLLENVMSRELAGTREIDRLRRQVASLRVAAGVLARDAFLGDTSWPGWDEAHPEPGRRVRRVLETRPWEAAI